MVNERRSRNGKLPGRKAGKLAIRIAHGKQHEIGYLDMRVNVDDGLFIAIDGDLYFESTSKEELKKYMEARAKANRQVVWSRYIVISYEAEGPGEFASRHRLKLTDRIEANDEGLIDAVGLIKLDWEIVDISEPIAVPGASTRRKSRDVWRDGQTGREDWLYDDKLPALAIPYSDAALEALKHMRHGLGSIHMTLARLFSGSPQEVAARLAAPNVRLLAEGDSEA